MIVEQVLYQALIAWPSIAALTGGRVYHLQRPEGEIGKAIVFQRVSTVPVVSLDGESGLDSVRVQVACIADNGLDALELAVAVRACIKASAALSGVPVMQVSDLVEQTGQVRSIIDFNIWQRN